MVRSLAALIATLMVAGCYIGPYDDGSADTHRSPQTAAYCSDGSCQMEESCSSCPADCGACVSDWDVDLGSSAVLDVSGTTRGRPDYLGVSCGDGGYAPEISYRWQAPYSDTFLVSLVGANFPALLAVRNGTSTGSEVACIDLSTGVSSLAVSISAGQVVVFVVDGEHGDAGDFRLTVQPAGSFCGDRTCDYGESCGSCPADCGSCSYCGDGTCGAGESCGNCPTDCGSCAYCGDGACNAGESCSSCPSDCGACAYCGDGLCSGGEDAWSCNADCGNPAACGDGFCDTTEDGWLCPEDCDVCQGYCGDGFCGGGEDGWSCAWDCAASCGDGFCGAYEDGWSCATDCTGSCGDGFCDPTENAWRCAADCASTCGDGYCGAYEDEWNCSWDCGVLCTG